MDEGKTGSGAPVHVAVTGAAGQVGYALLFRIASGQLLGPTTPVALRLLNVEAALTSLEGTAMELEDCAFPLLSGVEITADPKHAFRGARGVSWALLVGAMPRQEGDGTPRSARAEREHLLSAGPRHRGSGRLRRPSARGWQSLQYQLPHRSN